MIFDPSWNKNTLQDISERCGSICQNAAEEGTLQEF